MAISISSRIRYAMAGLTVALAVLFTGLIFLLVYVIEDQVFINQIKLEQKSYERAIASATPQAIKDWKPSNANIKLLRTAQELPNSLPAKVKQNISSQLGVHEYFNDLDALFVSHLSRSDNGESYYLIYDVKNLIAVRGTKATLFGLIGCITLIITAIAVLLARRLTNSALAPVSRLSGALKSNDLDEVVIGLANEFSEDEVGILTRELAQALERVQELVRREYDFNRGVSHELRSPIQVAQSATEILQLIDAEKGLSLDKPLSRLKRSVTEMNEIAEGFLWLASDRVLQEGEMCTQSALDNTLSKLKASFPNQQIRFAQLSSNFSSYAMPATVLTLLLRNLLRNAVNHGEPSTTRLEAKLDRVLVVNSVDPKSHKSGGFGIGLSIVKRICDRFDCALNIDYTDENTYAVSVVFPQTKHS